MANLGKALVGLGALVMLLGFALWLSPKVPGFSRLGRLPGDIHIQRDNFSFYFPWVTCLILSLVFTVILYLFRGMHR